MNLDAACEQVVAWFAERFLVDDKREAFKESLRRILGKWVNREEIPFDRGSNYDTLCLYIDYDPFEPLLTAVREAGVECDGCLLSAKGLFSVQKSGVQIDRRTGRVLAKEGYGAEWVTLLTPPTSPESTR